ncbi:hypothetical protein DCS_03619 [Drechmeria coniospora]|uniref:Uncharacterized protein n=1 Tax=Drechmeria coniospora TaxID=98403 RepID=A0A151GHR4_DRECN|nr:hypothetical protein DCS_03619 [Drechmeria coniospora]KYK56618.1 hypothetical protein DCS_03619 [Drechmeria coniospora]ODA77159.1 hypothetical protein RJ55_07678 [Drechmeria coniospora]
MPPPAQPLYACAALDVLDAFLRPPTTTSRFLPPRRKTLPPPVPDTTRVASAALFLWAVSRPPAHETRKRPRVGRDLALACLTSKVGRPTTPVRRTTRVRAKKDGASRARCGECAACCVRCVGFDNRTMCVAGADELVQYGGCKTLQVWERADGRMNECVCTLAMPSARSHRVIILYVREGGADEIGPPIRPRLASAVAAALKQVIMRATGQRFAGAAEESRLDTAPFVEPRICFASRPFQPVRRGPRLLAQVGVGVNQIVPVQGWARPLPLRFGGGGHRCSGGIWPLINVVQCLRQLRSVMNEYALAAMAPSTLAARYRVQASTCAGAVNYVLATETSK